MQGIASQFHSHCLLPEKAQRCVLTGSPQRKTRRRRRRPPQERALLGGSLLGGLHGEGILSLAIAHQQLPSQEGKCQKPTNGMTSRTRGRAAREPDGRAGSTRRAGTSADGCPSDSMSTLNPGSSFLPEGLGAAALAAHQQPDHYQQVHDCLLPHSSPTVGLGR